MVAVLLAAALTAGATAQAGTLAVLTLAESAAPVPSALASGPPTA